MAKSIHLNDIGSYQISMNYQQFLPEPFLVISPYSSTEPKRSTSRTSLRSGSNRGREPTAGTGHKLVGLSKKHWDVIFLPRNEMVYHHVSHLNDFLGEYPSYQQSHVSGWKCVISVGESMCFLNTILNIRDLQSHDKGEETWPRNKHEHCQTIPKDHIP